MGFVEMLVQREVGTSDKDVVRDGVEGLGLLGG